MSVPSRNLKFTKEHLKPGIDWARIQDEVDQIDIPGGYLHRDLIWILEELAALQMGYEDEAPETNEESLWDAAHNAYKEAHGNRITKGADQRKLLNAYHALRAQARHFEATNKMIYREGKRIFTSATKLRQIVRKALVQESREVPDIVGAITGVSGEKNRRKGIMGIVKQYGGKRIPKEGPWAPSQYEFPDEQIAAQVVWLIHDFISLSIKEMKMIYKELKKTNTSTLCDNDIINLEICYQLKKYQINEKKNSSEKGNKKIPFMKKPARKRKFENN